MIAQLSRPVSDAVIPNSGLFSRSLLLPFRNSPLNLVHTAMSRESAKRQRANTNGDVTAASTLGNAKADQYKAIIDTFDEQNLRDVLLAAALSYPDTAALIVKTRDDIRRKESAEVIDFDFQSKVAWHALNNRRDKRNGSRGYDAGIDAAITVSQTIAQIKEQTPAHASFGTKKSALVTLRKIGKSIALGGNHDEFGSQVIKTLSKEGDPLEEAMLEIVGAMTEEEKANMHADKEWVEKVKELVELGEDVDMFLTLEEMLEDLEPDERQTSDSSSEESDRGSLDGRSSEELVQKDAR